MKLTAAQKQKRYRQNLKKNGRHESMKAKNRLRMRRFRRELSDHQREQYRKRDAAAKKHARAAQKDAEKRSYGSKQCLSKAVKKVTKYLPNDKTKKKLVVQAIAESIGLFPQSSHKRTSRQLSAKLKDEVVSFYCRDDVSYQMPGKRDTIVVRENGSKSTYQKRILLYGIGEAHQLFLMEQNHSTPGVSRTSFSELRPQYVLLKSSMPHRVCVCLHHENVRLLIQPLAKYVAHGVCSDLQTFTNTLVCDVTNETCMFSKCRTCRTYFDDKIKANVVDSTGKIQWEQWTNKHGRTEKEEFEGTVEDCLNHLSSLVRKYLLHVFVKRAQSSVFERSKRESNDRKVVVQVDYSENFPLNYQDAVQSAHWNIKTLSIFTAYVWCGTSAFSFALVSNNVTHDKYCIDVCLNYIINHVKQHIRNVEEICFFSDGAASQFKQRYLFQNLTHLLTKYDLKISWNFFATSHGKGVVDAIGGTIKRMVWQTMLTKKQCRNAYDFVSIGKEKTNSIIIDEICQTEIEATTSRLQPIFDKTKPVKDTQKLHTVVAIRHDVIECRVYADSESNWTVLF